MMPDRWQRNIKMCLSGKSRASIKQQQTARKPTETAAERWRSRSAFKVFISRSLHVWQERRRLVSTSQEEHTVTTMILTDMKYLTQTNINCVHRSVPPGLLHTGAWSSLHQTHCSENKSTFSLLPVMFWKVRSIFNILYFYWKPFLLPRNTTLKRTDQFRQKQTMSVQTESLLPVLWVADPQSSLTLSGLTGPPAAESVSLWSVLTSMLVLRLGRVSEVTVVLWRLEKSHRLTGVMGSAALEDSVHLWLSNKVTS